MAILKRNLFWILTCALFIRSYADTTNPVRGVPGKDYPNYSAIPVTSFRCTKEHNIPGFYADPETRCQVFHFCFEHRQESFMCPSGTIFNEAIQACDYWYSSECSVTPLHYDTNPPNTVIAYDNEVEVIPAKTSPENVFDKMASLYQLDNSRADFGKYTDPLEENLFFSDREHVSLTNRLSKSIEYLSDKRDLVYDDYSGDYGDFQDAENVEDKNLKVGDFLEDFGKFSGETEVPEGFHKERYLVPSNEKNDFRNVQFEILENHKAVKIPYDPYSEAETYGHSFSENDTEDAEISGTFDVSTKEAFMSEDKLLKRQLEGENLFQKKSRRKPLITILDPHEAISPTEPTHEVSKGSHKSTSDIPTFASEEIENEPNLPLVVDKNKRRKRPVMIDLKDSLQYTTENGGHSDDGTKTSSINYSVYPDSHLPVLPIDDHEISVQLLPAEVIRKRKHFKYLQDLYDTGTDGEYEEQTFIDVTSPETNIYFETSTIPALKEMETFNGSDLVNSDDSRPIRKKNKIRILDPVEDAVELDNTDYIVTPLQGIGYEHETATPSIEKELQEIDNFPNSDLLFSNTIEEIKEVNEQTISPDISSEEYIVEMDPSHFVTEHDTLSFSNTASDTNNFGHFTQNLESISHFEVSQETDHTTYHPEIQTTYSDLQTYYLENILENKHSDNHNNLEEKPVSGNFRNIEEFELYTQEEIVDEPHFTTEHFSEITNMPIEIQSTENSDIPYFIPQSKFEPDYDYLDITDTTLSPNEEVLEEDHVKKFTDSDWFDSHPPYQIHSENGKLIDMVTERSNLEDIELQTILNHFNESDAEIEINQTSKSRENNVFSENRTSVTNSAQNIMDTYEIHYGEKSVLSNNISDEEFQEYFSHSNTISSSTNEEDTPTGKRELEITTPMPSLEIQHFLQDEAVNGETVTGQDEDFEDITHKKTNWNTNHEDQNKEMNNWNQNYEIETLATKESVQNLNDNINAMEDWDEHFEDENVATEQHDLNLEDHTNALEDWEENFEDESYAMKDQFQDFDENLTNADGSHTKLSKIITNNGGLSEIRTDLKLKHSENMDYSKQPIMPLPIQTMHKKSPTRKARSLDQMDFNVGALGSQYFSRFPPYFLNLKQSKVQKFPLHSIPELEDVAYFSRTDDLLQSRKISKLIAMGKNLLRSKKAKFRILSRYVNSKKMSKMFV